LKTIVKYALVTLLAACIVFPTGAVFAASSGSSDGSAQVGNTAATVINLGFYDSADSVDQNNTSIDVWTEYHVNCTVTDDNTLNDLENVTYIIWEETYADEGSADSNVNHYTFRYVNDTDAWEEVGPDAAGDSHLVSGNCSDPADHAATSGTFKLAFKLHKTANYTALTTAWKIKIIAYDSDTSGSNQQLFFDVNFFVELTVDDSSHAWSSLNPGDTDVLIDTPADGKIDVTATANAEFDLQAKGSGDLTKTGGGTPIGLGNVTIHKDTQGSSASLTESYADIGGLTGLSSGESQVHSLKLWIDVPLGTEHGTYTYTLDIQGVKA